MDNIEEKYFLTRGKVILFSMLLVVVIVVSIIIKYKSENSVEKYKAFEDELKNAAPTYVEINSVEVEDGEEKRIWMKQLLTTFSTDNDLKNRCNGYVILSSERDITTKEYEIVYRPYIKCGSKYMTTNYSEY